MKWVKGDKRDVSITAEEQTVRKPIYYQRTYSHNDGFRKFIHTERGEYKS